VLGPTAASNQGSEWTAWGFAGEIDFHRQPSADCVAHFQALSVFLLVKKDPRLQAFHGASRTRTGDLVGAIESLARPRTDLLQRFSGERLDCYSISRIIVEHVLETERPLIRPKPDLRESVRVSQFVRAARRALSA
jgi:hypothetical protein